VASLVEWVGQLREVYARSEQLGRGGSRGDAFDHVAGAPFEDGPLTRAAVDLAARIGRDVGVATGALGEPIEAFSDAAGDRFFPNLDAHGWAEVVLASAVRAYVPLLDAHGAWAPLDEETSIYDLRLEIDPPGRLWDQMTRTSLGVRIDEGPRPPLASGDVVLQIAGIATAGLSVEQVEQLSLLPEQAAQTAVTFLRRGEHAPIRATISSLPPPSFQEPAPVAHALHTERINYGQGSAAVLTIPDVPDDLGIQIREAIGELRGEDPPLGIVLDVRANGGGSTDGALDAIGVFLADRAMFPMRRRDGGIEIDRTPALSADEQWEGPVAVLTDGNSASAAEMIAGAVAAYRRGVVLGARTYGKGCAQEYMDDAANAGVLRLTTLLFSLPDGTPVQKVGVVPDIQLGLAPADESERQVTGTLEPWRGPDVRQRGRLGGPPWPSHGGRVGPCEDETVCRALRALGTAAAASR
jgi:carboxyl-terminal processing protease